MLSFLYQQKLKIVLTLSFFTTLFSLLSPQYVLADECQRQDGHCTVVACAFGNPLPVSCGLIPLIHCCPNPTDKSCSSLGGHCTLVACGFGAPLPASDCGIASRCCPDATNQSCNSLGGHCTVFACAFGENLPANDCGIAHCCPNSTNDLCADLNGHCSPACQGGAPLPASDCGLLRCCPNFANLGAGARGMGPCYMDEIYSAIGCIPVFDGADMGSFFLKWGLGIGGGIAFLFIIYAGFLLMTSAGDPGRVQAGKELLGSAVGGLLLLIFAVIILRIIGVDVLGIIPS